MRDIFVYRGTEVYPWFLWFVPPCVPGQRPWVCGPGLADWRPSGALRIRAFAQLWDRGRPLTFVKLAAGNFFCSAKPGFAE